MIKQIVVHPYREILLSNMKEQTNNTQNLDGSQMSYDE